jgi:hypothetical protein
MANYQKLQVGTALNIYKSDNANIPFANVIVAGTSAASALNELEDDTVDFIALNVQVGDVVYNTTTGAAATVIGITNTILVLNANLFTSANNYILYAQNTKEACVLYIGTGGNLRVLTASGQDVVFANVVGGTFLPVQVLKVFASGTAASNIVALW